MEVKLEVDKIGKGEFNKEDTRMWYLTCRKEK